MEINAAVCYEFGKPLAVEEVDLDPPRTGEVRVRVVASSICHSDVHTIRGDWDGPLPVVAGHEAAGIVEEIGPDVTLTTPGERVVVSLLRSCGRCFYCTIGSPHACQGTFALDQETRLHNKRREPLVQGIRMAAFAEQIVVDQSQVVALPADMPLDCAALLACGVVTGLGAVVNTARVQAGNSVVVIGTGGVGLNSVQGARLAGAHPIIAVDIIDSKLDAARTFGATHTVNAAREEPAAAMRALTGGRGADYAFVTVGSTEAMSQALTMIGVEGTVVIVGIPHAGATVPLLVRELVFYGQKVMGSTNGNTRLRVETPRLVDLYQHGRIKLDELITARYRLDDINTAIEAMERGQALRNVIML
jgi:S-(hydroxymethyl)glutathione dehydrogenase/alcohol dehydrogenase